VDFTLGKQNLAKFSPFFGQKTTKFVQKKMIACDMKTKAI